MCCWRVVPAAAGMALPLCLDRLVNVAVALVLSTTAIVLFGECAAAVLLWGARAAATAGLCSCSRACGGAGEVNDGCSGVGGQQGRRHVSGVGGSPQHRWSGRAHIISTHLSPGTIACVLPRAFHLRPGEILPQAVCSRYGLSIGGHAAPVVRLLMWLTAPISWPIGKGLDWMLGKEQPVFGKRQISALVDLHRCACVSSSAAHGKKLRLSGLQVEQRGEGSRWSTHHMRACIRACLLLPAGLEGLGLWVRGVGAPLGLLSAMRRSSSLADRQAGAH